jgi:hypothetical protein
MRQYQYSNGTILPRSATVSLLLVCLVLPACAPAVTVTAPISKITAAVADDLVCRTSDDNSVADMPGTFKSFLQREGTVLRGGFLVPSHVRQQVTVFVRASYSRLISMRVNLRGLVSSY